MRRALSFGIGLGATLFVGAAPVERPTFTDFTEQAGIAFKQSFGDHELDNIVEGTGTRGLPVRLRRGRLARHLLPERALDRRTSATTVAATSRRSSRTPSTATTTTGPSRDVTDKAGVAGKGAGFGCSAADYDDDGDVDL